MLHELQEPGIPSVGQLTANIKRMLEGSFRGVRVKGEISNLKLQQSGHLYFTLKDKDAQLSAVMFRGDVMRLGWRPSDGKSVVVRGDLSVYEPRGQYQLIVRDCIEEGLGKLQLEFERLKRELQSEGLFEAERKRPIPVLPRCIGIVTSPTGAAFRDFVSILQRRSWTGRLLLFPSLVQGSEGAKEIVSRIAWAQQIPDLELLVVGRGGGSLEDLWNFNEADVVRAVAASRIPVISAVGHEVDIVLTDFAADKRAETPSAAAELISSGYLEMVQRLERASHQMGRRVGEALNQYEERLRRTSQHLKALTPTRFVENRMLWLDDLIERLQSRSVRHWTLQLHRLERLSQRLEAIPVRHRISSNGEHLNQVEHRLVRAAKAGMSSGQQQLDSWCKRLESVGLDQVLRRGFAWVSQADGRPCDRGALLADREWLQLHFQDGTIDAQVRKGKQLDLFDA
jgi:exodeoxyribonuclease VII large subunit